MTILIQALGFFISRAAIEGAVLCLLLRHLMPRMEFFWLWIAVGTILPWTIGLPIAVIGKDDSGLSWGLWGIGVLAAETVALRYFSSTTKLMKNQQKLRWSGYIWRITVGIIASFLPAALLLPHYH